MKTLAASSCLSALLTLAFVTGCDESGGKKGETNEVSAQTKAEKKKATVDALLRQNGIDPSTLPTAGDSKAAPAAAQGPSPAPAAGSAQPPSAQQVGSADLKLEVLDAGTGPKKVLRYAFKKDRTHRFHLDMEVVPKRVVNGQPTPDAPAVNIGMKGSSLTIAVGENSAQRENTFLDFTPSGEGIPPMLLEQMKAQFAPMRGIQLVQTISNTGKILETGLKEGTLSNPQLLSVVQNLKDGMSNSFLALPDEPVGVGAKWKETTQLMNSGIPMLQENVVHLKSIKGDQATFEITLTQSATPQKIPAAGLPPGATVELMKLEGSGTGNMSINFSTLIIESKVSLKMTVDTKVSGPGMPEPLLSATDTSMKLHMRVTK